MAVAEKQGLDIGGLLQGVSSVAGLLAPRNTSTKTSGGTRTQTSGLDITQEGRMKLIQDILGGTSGLASVAGGQRAAGLFNSSTNQMLVNDLVDRASASVDRDTARTTTTTVESPTTQLMSQAPQVGLGTAAALAGGAYGAKKLYDVIAGGADVASAGSSLAGALASPGSDVLGSIASSNMGNFSNFLNFTGSSAGGADLLGNSFSGMDFLGSKSAAAGAPWVSMGMDVLNGDVEGALGTGAGFMLGNMIMPGIGGPIGSVVSQILPVDSIIKDVGSAIGGLFGGSVVCTELLRQGLMSKELYISDVVYASKKMNPTVLRGYRFWGIPLVRLMRKSKRVTKIAAFFAVSRAHYIAAISKKEFAPWRADLGWAINLVGVPLCWMLGKTLEILEVPEKSTIRLLTE